MSNSNKSEDIAAGVGEEDDRVNRIFPFEFRNLRIETGVSEGPKPLDFGGRTIR
jgi:hypothetical protein